MPVAKIHVLDGRYDNARLDKVSKAVQHALMGTLGVPPDDFFQIIDILPRSQLRHTPSFLGLKYSDDLILLEVTFISGRPKEKRLALLKAFNEGVVAAAGISPDDLMITLYGVPGENMMLLGTIFAGIGFGAAFSGSMRTVMPQAEAHERAGLLSAFYVERYLSFSLPAILTGLLAPIAGMPLAANNRSGWL